MISYNRDIYVPLLAGVDLKLSSTPVLLFNIPYITSLVEFQVQLSLTSP